LAGTSSNGTTEATTPRAGDLWPDQAYDAFVARRTSSQAQSVRLKPADPFDLIRWLARSQSDPRKAVAELVQNSIDANARRVRLERRRVRRAPALVVRDDGEGVLPELSREDALRTIATNIGCSRKRNLTPIERQAQVVAGKYGIGLLGFWAVGRMMDIRSRVGGSEVYVLRLREDEERAEIFRDRFAMDEEPSFTEVVVTEVHEAATRVLSARRLAEYLAAELRGALLQSGADVSVHDGLARGTAPKHFSVVPRRYTGERLPVPDIVEVPGFSPMRLELYLARGAERPAVELGCAGTLVADDLAALDPLGFAHPPWVGRGLSGLIDFPDFNVPPGSRRGVAPDAAAEAFAIALHAFEPSVTVELDRLDRQRGTAANRQVMGDLRRAFRGLQARLPQYELPAVDSEDGPDTRAAGASSGVLPVGSPPPPDSSVEVSDAATNDGEAAPVDDDREDDGSSSGVLDLFPPGPLAAVTVIPPEVEIPIGRERRVRARATDAEGRRLADVAFEWASASPVVSIASVARGGRRPALLVAATARAGAREVVMVTARQGDRVATAHVTVLVSVVDDATQNAQLGIPEPELIDEPTASWRSRFDGQRWQVNAAHEDFAALVSEPRARVRYLLTLLAKEIVQRTHGGPGTEVALEGLVEILAHAERNLRGG
jgi:Histidine kinase-, DNA gyrase B-, and HSP90-like ATPase